MTPPLSSGPASALAAEVPTPLLQSLFRRVLTIALVPLVLLLVVLTMGTWKHLESTAISRTADVVRARAQTLEMLLAGWRERVRLHANELAATQASDFNEVLKGHLEAMVAAGEPFEAAFVTDASGHLVDLRRWRAQGVGASDLTGLDLSANEWFREAIRDRQMVWTQTYQSLLTRHITAAIVAPIPGKGVIVAELSLEQFASLLASRLSAADELTVVIDRRGRVVGHRDAALAAQQTDMARLRMVRESMGGGVSAGSFEWRARDWIGSAQEIPGTSWAALVAEPRDRLLAPLWALLGWFIASGAVGALVSLVAARRLAAAEADRHRELLDAALEAEAGADVRIRFRIAEFDRLWAELQELIRRIKRNEASAREARRRMQAVFDAASEVAIVVTDLDGHVATFNRGTEKMLGWQAVGAIAAYDMAQWWRRKAAADLTDADTSVDSVRGQIEDFDDACRVALTRGQDTRDRTFVRTDGTRFRASVATTVIRDGDDGPAGMLMVITDMSDREAAERALAASRAKSDFLSRISHELRTPMNAVLGFAQVLSLRLAPRLNDDECQQLSNIQTAGWHLLGLIDDLLDLSRLEAGTLRIARAIVPMRQCAQQALNLLSERAVSASITLHLDMPEGEVAAWADPARLRQVFINLVSNSIKYNRPGGVCEVRIAFERGGRVACEVADSGLGMSPDQMSHLFEPFNRLGRESLSAEGHGIGLLIVRELVEAMGGKLVVTSQPGVGTSIRFTLQAADAADAAASGFTPLATDACDVDEIVDVVLLEDNEVNVVLIESVIKLRPRCRLHVATSGREAVQLLRRIRPRLALLDINVPDLNGLEVLRLAIADPTTVDTAYVMLSADAGDQSVSQSLAAGAAAYLFKPVNIEELLEVIDRLALRTVRTAICPEA